MSTAHFVCARVCRQNIVARCHALDRSALDSDTTSITLSTHPATTSFPFVTLDGHLTAVSAGSCEIVRLLNGISSKHPSQWALAAPW